ncbi:YnaM/YnfT family protein, partial [Klebsiella pneumoniae]|uniref:YnaM/YnfT family protein n=1 Tax=Klebsiella pneumoniae TaxID=573 RepID=UPI0028699276
MFISTTLFALFASMLIGLGMVWKSISNNPDREGANKQVISSQADSLIKISRIWADFFPANTS